MFRRTGNHGKLLSDVVGLATETRQGEEPLLKKVMADGVRLDPRHSVDEIRARAQKQLSSLPPRFLRLRRPAVYPVKTSPDLERLFAGKRGGP